MCRGEGINFSIKTRLVPNADWLSRTAPSSAASKSACLSTRRMPRPPPPAAGLLHKFFGMILESHRADCACRRTDKDETRLRARVGEIRVLGQKTVARMNAFGAGLLCRRDQMVDRKIACARLRASD